MINLNYSELNIINDFLFLPNDITIESIEDEAESKEYFAHRFKLNGNNTIFRTAKITPTKTGQFVTIWKRNKEGFTEPFAYEDDFIFLMIVVRQNENFGIFIFQKNVLLKKSVISKQNNGGKRGMRVYPPWNNALNNQAQKTQQWQSEYFINLSKKDEIDLGKVKMLFELR